MKLAFPIATIAAATLATLLTPNWAHAQASVSAQQRAAAQAAAEQGVAVSELAPNAPTEYVVRRGDTLWGISGKFLRNTWRWPALWGMNMDQIRNPHLIYPGQRLWLETVNGRARLRTGSRANGDLETVRVTPRNRVEALDASPLPTLPPHLIEPFLARPLVLDDDALNSAARIVSAREGRVMAQAGDKAFARGPEDDPLLMNADTPRDYRVFREAKPLKDPDTGEILGYESVYVGKVKLTQGESAEDIPQPVNPPVGPTPSAGEEQYSPDEALRTKPLPARFKNLPVPATVEIQSAIQEIRPGDRMVPEPASESMFYTPHSPIQMVDARVISVYGDGVDVIGQNQIVSLNRGARDGMAPGQIVALISTGSTQRDQTREGNRAYIKLPDQRNGMGMVFKVYEKVSYVLILQIQDGVKPGDKVVNP